MNRIARFRVLFFRLAPLLFAVGGFAVAAASEPIPPKTYGEAIQEAERDLRQIEAKDEATGGWKLSDYLGLVALLAAICLMLWVSRWTRRLFFRQMPGREMRVLDRMAVGRTSSLLLVKVRGRVYWLADHPAGITRLDDWPDDTPAPDAVAAPVNPPYTGT